MPTTFDEWVVLFLLTVLFWIAFVAILGEWPCDREHVRRPPHDRGEH